MAPLIWRGDAFRNAVLDDVAARLEKAGAAGAQVARELVPVKTGRTRGSIGYTFDRSTMTLQIYATSRWAVCIEMGTSHMPARPFLRPAMAVVGRMFGGDINVQMNLRNASTSSSAKSTGAKLKLRGSSRLV